MPVVLFPLLRCWLLAHRKWALVSVVFHFDFKYLACLRLVQIMFHSQPFDPLLDASAVAVRGHQIEKTQQEKKDTCWHSHQVKLVPPLELRGRLAALSRSVLDLSLARAALMACFAQDLYRLRIQPSTLSLIHI